ncbi:MAG: YeeE/YedE family protein [Fusobacterium sp. JB021]|nr:YeeE/YedE family protein [Fusobacterium sp. JB020]MDP0493098.1 YeeE/YedE family protein [Fusobacterium sp. JB021]
MKKKENILGILLLGILIFFGHKFLNSGMLFFRLLMGATLGYALTRSFMGFAGSVNRAYNGGSTKLMRVLAGMFTLTALISVAFLYNVDASTYDLWVNPINTGLILGGLLFGFGMTFSVCCASGVLTDLVTGLPRAIITLLFFGMGVFLGFPIQSKASWVTDSWFTTEVGSKLYGGVYLPDLFKGDGLNGYIGASLITILLAGITVWISYKYEDSRKLKNNFSGVESETIQYSKNEEKYEPFKLISERTYNTLFVKPWTMETGAVVITGVFTLLMGITKAGWGASTPYGFWFGKLLFKLGIPLETITSFSTKPAKVFTMPFFDHPINVQNFGIVLGTIICLLLTGTFTKTFTSELKISAKDVFLFALGGICMGIGTRLSNGCNVGALYTPIANFSLSGWIFFIFLVLGGIVGNKVAKVIK